MKASQTPVLHYGPTYVSNDPVEGTDDHDAPRRKVGTGSKVNEVVTWCVLGICLAGWAVVGFFLWIPRVLQAVLLFSAALVQSTVMETGAARAGRRLRSAANFYKRGFVGAVEAIRSALQTDEDDEEDEAGGAWSIEPRMIVRETAWSAVVWFFILWPFGVLALTPLDVVSIVVTAPWAEMWSALVDGIMIVPNMLRG